MITIDDFKKVELRTAKVLQVDPHPNADRLWVLQLEVGAERRQIVAGIRAHYTAEQLLGKTIVMVANLEPAMLRGVESQGMLLAVRDGEKVVTLTTDQPTNTGLQVS
ncbi:MAG: methionine--tRNA ligase subunit beta [Planctomycetes bacterium]|nr:methionine--tRNA ligase subunit beta [Planctomycetota bacterium]